MSFADDLYESMRPLAARDEQEGWALRDYTAAMGEPFEWVYEQAYDSDWALIMNPDTCPPEGLAWLGQFVGVRVTGTPEQQREQIKVHIGLSRGKPDGIKAAIAATLTGERSVYLAERLDGNAYHLGIVTRTAETPDPALTLAVAKTVVPAGIVIGHGIIEGQSYVEAGSGATYDFWKATYANYDDLRTLAPGQEGTP